MKAQRVLAFLVLICVQLQAQDALNLSSPQLLRADPSTRNLLPDYRNFGHAVTAGANTLVFWVDDRSRNGSPRNILASPITANGNLLFPSGSFVAPLYYGDTLNVVSVGEEFFVCYNQHADGSKAPPNSWTYFTMVRADATTAFPPRILHTNDAAFWNPNRVCAATAKFVAVAWMEPSLVQSSSIRYIILDRQGNVLFRNSINLGKAFPDEIPLWIQAAQDSLLLLWRDSEVHAEKISALIGNHTPVVPFSINPLIRAFASNGREYLAVVGTGFDRNDGYLIDADGKISNEAAFSFSLPTGQAAILPLTNGWALFCGAKTYQLLPANGGTSFQVKTNLFPALSSTPSGTNSFALLGNDKLVIALNPIISGYSWFKGYSLYDSRGWVRQVDPPSPASEGNLHVVVSPLGYMVAWTSDTEYPGLNVMRFKVDGTLLDVNSVPVGSRGFDVLPDPVFDGNDYLVFWRGFGSAEIKAARISPLGEPNVRTFSVTNTFLGGVAPPQILPWKEKLLMTQMTGADTMVYIMDREFHIQQTNSVSVPNARVGVSGDDILMVSGLGSGVLNAHRLAVEPEVRVGDPVQIGTAPLLNGGDFARIASIGKQFAVLWNESPDRLTYARIREGQLIERRVLAQSVRTSFTFSAGANGEDFLFSLLTDPTKPSSTNTLWTVNAQSGEILQSTQLLRISGPRFSIGGSGEDFLLGELLLDPHTLLSRVYLQSLFRGVPARFNTPFSTAPERNIELTLDSRRKYRIEQSADLKSWSARSYISNSSLFSITRMPDDTNLFIRAVTVPK
jgi:hypothetical protein